MEFEQTERGLSAAGTFTQQLGLDIVENDGTYTTTLPVTQGLTQPMGIVHGGIYAAVAEEIASQSTFRAVAGDGRIALGQSNLTHFLRPAKVGNTLHVTATPQHRGRTTWVWLVEIRDDEGRMCATTTVTMAVRERR